MISTLEYSVILTASFIASYGLTNLYRTYALRRGVIDTPNSRSSHKIPTPRGGGISIIFCWMALCIFAFAANVIDATFLVPVMTGGLATAAIGFLDDHIDISSKIRFCVHLASSIIAVLSLDQLPSLPLAVFGALPVVILTPLLVLFFAWMINLYNFMDGIDGIAGGEALSVLLAAAILLSGDSKTTSLALLALTPSLIGFLLWNKSPAKIFMGDGASGFIGFFLALCAAYTASNTALNSWCWLILLGAFIVDASWTLFTRILTRQPWHQPHRSHSYQILSRNWQSHMGVTGAIIAVNLVWLTPLAFLAMTYPVFGPALLLVAWGPLIAICFFLKAGQPEQ